MSGIEVGLVIFAVMLALMVVRVPIGIAMFVVGFGGYLYLTGNNVNALLNSLKNLAYARLSNYDLVVIPLFLLMGQFATHGGLSTALFRFVGAFLGHHKGGVAMAAIGACAGFGAICGSSVATAATMGQVALPELRRFGYSGSLATGALAAGGTLGIMIPPSVPLVIYAILTQESFPWEVVPGLKIQEIAKTHTETPPGQPYPSNTIFVVAMHQAKYDSLPADLKKVIDANSGLAASKWAGQVWDSTIVPARKLAVERKNTINVLTMPEFERWKKATEGVEKEWFTEVGAKGGNGPALLDDAKALLKKYGG